MSSREDAKRKLREKIKAGKEKPLIVKHVKDKIDEAISKFNNSRKAFEEYDAIAESFKELDTLGASSKFDTTPESD